MLSRGLPLNDHRRYGSKFNASAGILRVLRVDLGGNDTVMQLELLCKMAGENGTYLGNGG
jgi:hypothetical protein